ncbi:cation diffusion facilitator family transporter [Marinomonas sp. C2222]|uniref:Cation diffusion facilitator family transporter n=1 Tax=Marinomonas sargassi TaxID=2984494 RepID=A0ABT2YR63_9GAMM|nr:cation diffusion facilitator family transporter [Marinomonas sargassi]MCV2402385.1 cation diffusion facilitator family transporter [Marinomonas sargassi]
MSTLNQEKKIAKRVTLVGAFWDAVLGLVKIVAGHFSQSQALLADGIHSLSDLITDLFVYFTSAKSRQGPDHNHPYGHLRFETLTTVFLGLVLIIVALGIVYDSLSNQSLKPQSTWYGLAAILLTIIVKEAIFHYTKKAGEQINSKMLIANAWHSRSDALSSIAVLAGFVGIYLGYPQADVLASIIVAALIAKLAISMIWENLAELVDTAPDPELIKRIVETAQSLKEVMAPHDVRARSMAGKVYLDMHIHVPKNATVSEGHYLGDLVAYTIKKAHPEVVDVLVHIDTNEKIQTDSLLREPTTEKPPLLKLPARNQILADLKFLLRQHESYVDIPDTRLHYLHNHLSLEIIATSDLVPEQADLKQLTASILQDIENAKYIKNATVLWRIKS